MEVMFTNDVKYGKNNIIDQDSKKSERLCHDDLIKFQDIIKYHALNHNQIAGFYGVEVSKLGKKERQAYDDLFDSIKMNSISFSVKEDGEIYAVVIALKMSINGNVNVITPNIQLSKPAYSQAAGLNDACMSYAHECGLWLEGKSGDVNLFTQAKEEEEVVEEAKEILEVVED